LQYAEAFHGSGLAAIEKTKGRAGGDPTHDREAAARRAETNITRKRRAREWDEQHGKLVDLSAFQRDIPLSRLQQATGLSLRYLSLIRRGERTPHPRHWQPLLEVTEADSRFGQKLVTPTVRANAPDCHRPLTMRQPA
jgi:hypothetical protein